MVKHVKTQSEQELELRNLTSKNTEADVVVDAQGDLDEDKMVKHPTHCSHKAVLKSPQKRSSQQFPQKKSPQHRFPQIKNTLKFSSDGKS